MNGLETELSAFLMNAAPEEIVMDYQVESERGFQLLGSAVYTSNTLLPMDPAHFTSIQGEPLGSELTDFEVPDNTWVWAWSRWYVDMSSDVDDQGWCYSWRFRSNKWSGRHRFFRSFVRQRLWKRPRVKRTALIKGPPTKADLKLPFKPESSVSERPDEDVRAEQPEEEEEQEEASEEAHRKIKEIISDLQKLRNDREKIDWLLKFVCEQKEEISWIMPYRAQILGQLTFPVSRRHLIVKMSESDNRNCQLMVLAPSSTWRDQVMVRGQPESELDVEDQSVQETTVNGL